MLALLCTLALAAPPAPHAPPAGVVAAAPGGGDGLRFLVVAPGADAARVEELYAGLRAAGLQPVELDERAGVDREAPPPPPPADRDAARARLQDAKVRFRELDLDGTRAALEDVFDEVLRLQRPEDALEILADALLLRATLALQSGLEDEAREALVLLARLEPSRAELHPGLYAPSLVEAYAAARADEQARDEAPLVVRPRVAGFAPAELLIDGAPVAVGAVTELRRGPHLVTVRAAPAASAAGGDDPLPFSRIVDVGADPVALEPFLAPADAPERRAALVARARAASTDEARSAHLAQLARLAAARAVLYVDAAALLWVDGRPPELLRAAPTAAGALIGRATLAALQAPARKESGLAEPDPAPALDVTSIVVIGTVAVAVIALATGVGTYVLLPSDPDVGKPPPRAVEGLGFVP